MMYIPCMIYLSPNCWSPVGECNIFILFFFPCEKIYVRWSRKTILCVLQRVLRQHSLSTFAFPESHAVLFYDTWRWHTLATDRLFLFRNRPTSVTKRTLKMAQFSWRTARLFFRYKKTSSKCHTYRNIEHHSLYQSSMLTLLVNRPLATFTSE